MSISFRRRNSGAFGKRVVRFFNLLLLLLLAGALGRAQAAGIALVQHTGKDAGTTTTTTLPFASANTAGNFIAVTIRGGLSNSQVFTVRDSVGNTYKQATQLGLSGSAVTMAIYYAENIRGGSNTISVSMTASGPLRIAIAEYSGIALSNSLDGTAAATLTSTSPNSGNLTTNGNGDLLLGTAATADSDTFTAGAGYNIRDFVPVEPNTKLISEERIQVAAGAASATATLAVSSNWGAVLAAFTPASGGGGTGTPATITATAGTPQNATVNTPFAIQLQATVKDSLNNPVSGATVTFAAPVGGASGTFTAGVTTATTNVSGIATAAVFTANTVAGGPYTVTAAVSGVATPANFSLANLPGAASTITATAGTPQSTTVNTAFGTQLRASVKDSFNNPVSGVTVTFTAPQGGTSGTFANGINTATTSVSGVATAAVFSANTVAGGPYTVTASVSSVAAPANFSLTNLTGAVAGIAATAGTPQSAPVNTAFATQLQATVKDSFSNPVSGVTVTFTAPGNGASGAFAGGVNTATTNTSGIANAAAFTANGTAGGPYTVTASTSGVSTSANFSLTNLGNPPANITATSGTPQSAAINTAFATRLQVSVTDSGSNPVNGVTVTFTAPSSGASGAFAGGVNTATTNASGVATSAVFTANSNAGGPYIVAAFVSGVSTPASFSLTNVAGAAASITATAGSPQSVTVGTAYLTQFQATVKDAGANPVNGVTVTFSAPASGASGIFAGGVNTATTDASGVATAAVFTANTTAGGPYNVTATVSGVATAANFALTNLAGAAANIAASAGTPQSATVNATFTTALQVTVRDVSNNLVSGATVTFAAPTSGASGTFAGGVNTATTNAQGVATAPLFTANATAGGPYTVTASAAGVATPANFSLTNLANVTANIALVQHTSKDAGTTTSSTLAFASANSAGNFIAVTIRGGLSSSQVFTVKDSNGNTYKQATQLGLSASAVTMATYYAENTKGGANTVTVSMTVSGPLRFAILEYSGVATSNSLDATAGATGTSTSPNSANLTTTASGDLLLGSVATADSVAFTAGTGYAIRDFVPAEPNTKLISEDRIQVAAGAASATAIFTPSSNWGAVLAAFKPASGGGGAGIPATITATAGTPQNATVNTPFAIQLQATVKDSLNNPVSGATVTFAAPASGASGTFAAGVTTATTNVSGIATAAVFTANNIAGSAYAVTASVIGVSTSANFSLTNLAGSASSIAATGGTPQSAAVNTSFATPLQATVKDPFNNPVSGVTVTFTAPSGGAGGTFANGVNAATTNAQGVAIAPIFTANATIGGPYTVTASASGIATTAGFSLTNVLASGNIALVQHRSIDSAPATSNSLAFVTTTTAGNWIAVSIRGGLSNSQIFTVSDSSGNTYHQAFRLGLTNSSNTLAFFYAENINGGPDTITVTQTVFGPLRFAILEYSGVATTNSLDGAATAQGSSTSPNSGPLTTSANGDLLLGTIITQNNNAFTAGSGYTIEESVPASPITKLIAEDQLQSAAGTASARASLSAADNWGAGLAAFRSITGTILPISVSVSPSTSSVPSGYGTQTFTATVTNDFLNRGVTWSLSGVGCSGSSCGTLTRVTTTSATYVAPLNVPSPAAVTLTATSIGDATKSASSITTLTQGVLTLVLSPKRAAVTMSSSPVQFTASIFYDPSNSGVTWQVDGNNGGTSSSGTISATGLYTPGTQPGQHTVTAISNANASVSASASMAVTDFVGMYTHHNDNARTGQNLKEYGLSPATVNSASFGQLFSCPVDGYVYAQPLWVANLNFGGIVRNAIFIATEHNSVYAFDADSPSCVQLWKMNFLGSGVTTLTSSDIQSNTDIVPEIGITSTPVIDPTTNTLYVIPKTRETVGTVNGQVCSTGSPCYVHRLHALDLATGAEKFGGPVVIAASNFIPLKELQRPALLLANNMLYFAFGSHGDLCPYQGWIMAYNPSTLGQIFANSLADSRPSAGCNQGAIWLSGAGPSTDASGNVYFVTGNGLYDGALNFGDTVVKMSPTGSILDWFTPFNQSTLATNDVDLGSAAVLILPDSVGSALHPHLALTTGKTAVLYLLDQTNMGKFNSITNNDIQEVIPVPPPNATLNDGGNYGGPAYWNGNIYTTGQNFPLSQFQISNGAISTPQSANSSNTFPPRGGIPAVSANRNSGGVVWIVDYSGWVNSTPAVLDAYDATNVGTLLYSSPVNGAGSAGPAVKWSVPTVANGRVYVGTQFSFSVYGLLPN